MMWKGRILFGALSLAVVDAMSAGGIKSRAFVYNPLSAQSKPKLILIGGCPGTGKSYTSII